VHNHVFSRFHTTPACDRHPHTTTAYTALAQHPVVKTYLVKMLFMLYPKTTIWKYNVWQNTGIFWTTNESGSSVLLLYLSVIFTVWASSPHELCSVHCHLL